MRIHIARTMVSDTPSLCNSNLNCFRFRATAPLIMQRITHIPNCTVMKWSQSIFILNVHVCIAEYSCTLRQSLTVIYLSMYVGLVVYEKLHSASLSSSSSTVQGSLVTELSINLCMKMHDSCMNHLRNGEDTQLMFHASLTCILLYYFVKFCALH